MSLPGFVPGMPGIRTRINAVHRIAFRGGQWTADLAGGKVIDGTKSRDPGNTGDVGVLRAGLLMGKVTANGKYAPSIIGVLTGAAAAAATTVNVSVAAAIEIVRRIGATGTLRFVGPPTANGTVATFTETYSAVNTGTGAVTVSALDAALVAGSFVCADDGSHLPLSLIPDGYGAIVTEFDGVTSLDAPFAEMPVAGLLQPTQLLPVWPTDTSLQSWLELRLNDHGKFIFSTAY